MSTSAHAHPGQPMSRPVLDLLDLLEPSLNARELVEGLYEERARLVGSEAGDVPFGIATAHVDLAALLR